MKKLLAISASAVLAASVFALSACSNGNENGVIKGDYKEASQEQVMTEMSNINTEKAFDLNGIELSANFNAEYDFGTTKGTSEVSADFKLTYDISETNFALAGAGNGSVKFDNTANGVSNKVNYSAQAYVDSEYAYFNVTGDNEIKGKISFEYIYDMIQNIIPFAVSDYDSDDDYDFDFDYDIEGDYDFGDIDIEGGIDIGGGIFDSITDLGLKYYIDNSNGLKIKVSVPEEAIWTLIESSEAGAMVAMLKNTIVFNTYELDLYMAFDKDGGFSQFSINMNIDAKSDYSSLGSLAEGQPEMTLKASGYLILKAYNGTVKLPDGLATDESYNDLSSMLG